MGSVNRRREEETWRGWLSFLGAPIGQVRSGSGIFWVLAWRLGSWQGVCEEFICSLTACSLLSSSRVSDFGSCACDCPGMHT